MYSVNAEAFGLEGEAFGLEGEAFGLEGEAFGLEGEAFGLNQNLDPADPKPDTQAPEASCISCVSWFLSPPHVGGLPSASSPLRGKLRRPPDDQSFGFIRVGQPWGQVCSLDTSTGAVGMSLGIQPKNGS